MEDSPSTERRPACDNCKSRKTKCDRRSPCSSCVTLDVPCRQSRRPGEKRQRVLLSPRYDEAMQDVNRQLGEMREMIQALISRDAYTQKAAATAESSHQTPPPRPMIDEQVPDLSSIREGYTGDSSFQSHVHQARSALEASTPGASELVGESLPATTTSAVPEIINKFNPCATPTASSLPESHIQSLDPGNLPLPPVDIVLKLLRLIKTQKQRFFIDVPIFQEEDFINLCRDVFFATEPISLWTWICVNVGLYNIFFALSKDSCRQLDITTEAARSHCKILKENAESAMQSLRLCSEPSLESCRALTLLGEFYVKEGHTTVAWRLISAAARGCLDLGLHRLSDKGDNQGMDYHVFWHIYTWDKGLALTCGKTPAIHHYDVTTTLPMPVEQRHSAIERIYGAWLDYAVLSGEVQQNLFSGSARHMSLQVRAQHVQGYATRIRTIQESINSVSQNDPTWDEMFAAAAVILDIKTYSLLTIVYRVLPPTSRNPHPLQCSDECVYAARMALSTLVKVGQNRMQQDPTGWTMLLNLILSMVPFVSFIVLAGNAIATSSSTDLDLLSSALAVLEPATATSNTVRKIRDACERFGRVARLMVVSAAGETTLRGKSQGQSVNDGGLPLDITSNVACVFTQLPTISADDFPMTQQDWDSIMTGFEAELGYCDPGNLTSVVEPYISNTGW